MRSCDSPTMSVAGTSDSSHSRYWRTDSAAGTFGCQPSARIPDMSEMACRVSPNRKRPSSTGANSIRSSLRLAGRGPFGPYGIADHPQLLHTFLRLAHNVGRGNLRQQPFPVLAHGFRRGNLWLPAQCAKAGYVRDGMPRISKPEAAIQHRRKLHPVGVRYDARELQHRIVGPAAYMEDLIIGLRTIQDQQVGRDHIPNVNEIPELPPILVNNGLPFLVAGEAEYAACAGVGVSKRLPRALHNRVAQGHRRNPIAPAEMDGDPLLALFGYAVGILRITHQLGVRDLCHGCLAVWTRQVPKASLELLPGTAVRENLPVVWAVIQAFAQHGLRRSYDHFADRQPLAHDDLVYQGRAGGVDVDETAEVRQIVLISRQMIDHVHAGQGFGHRIRIPHVTAHAFKFRGQVCRPAAYMDGGLETIQEPNIISARQQRLGCMGADEAGAACDQNSHICRIKIKDKTS